MHTDCFEVTLSRRFRVAAFLLATTALSFATSAPAATDTVGGALEEVTVTAQKRAQNLQDVPISISAYTSADIQNLGFREIGDIGYVVPNLTWAQLTTLSQAICMRGVCSDSSVPGFDTSIAVILDDVYIGRAAGFAPNLLDVDRIEVLRGPQGTLQGRNVTGGSINIVSSRPSDVAGGIVDLSYGNYDQLIARAFVTGSLIGDELTGKISVARASDDGYGENIDVHKPLDTEDSISVRGQLRFRPSGNLEMLLTGDYSHFNNHDFHNAFGPPDLTEPPPQLFSRQVGGDIQNFGYRNVFGGALNVYWTLPNQWQLASISSYRGYRVTDYQDADGTQNFGPAGAGTLLGMASQIQDQRQFSQELRLSSQSTGPLTWIGGMYFFWEDLHDYENFLFGFNTGQNVAGTSSISDARTHTNSIAGYGSVTWTIDSFWGITAGLRDTRDSRSVAVTETQGQDGVNGNGPYVNYPTLQNPVPATFLDPIIYPTNYNSVRVQVWTGDLSIMQHWSEDISTYLKYAHGFKGGGFNATFNSGASGQAVNPEYVDSFEGGIRTELFHGWTRLNATVFYVKDRDQQVVVFDPATFLYVTSNAPRTKSYGSEIDLTQRIVPTVTTSLGIGLTNAHVTAGEWDGNAVPGTSQVNATATVRYVKPLMRGLEFYGFVDGSWHDGYYTAPDNEPVSHQKSYTWVDLRAGIQSANKRWNAGLYDRNALNTNLLESGSNITGLFSVGFIGPPRTYGVEGRYKF